MAFWGCESFKGRSCTATGEGRGVEEFTLVTERRSWKALMDDGTGCDIGHGRGPDVLCRLCMTMMRSRHPCIRGLYKNWELGIISDRPHRRLLHKGRRNTEIFQGRRCRSSNRLMSIYTIIHATMWRGKFRRRGWRG